MRGQPASSRYGPMVIECTLPFKGDPPARESCVLSQGFAFNRQSWRSGLPREEAWPQELDTYAVQGRWPRITRQDVFTIARRATDATAMSQLFAAAAVWGTGTAGRGRVRRLRVFEQDPESVGERLARARGLLKSCGPLEAYEFLHGRRNAIPNLGPSFGTKVLYFAGYEACPGPRPLILDQYVTIALNRLCHCDWSTTGGWSTTQYGEYLDLAGRWAAEWGTKPDVIERILFSVGKSQGLAVSALPGR